MPIVSVKARELLDSRGNPTVETEIKTEKGIFSAMVPSGASTGIYEALELRDGDKNRFLGRGVLKAVNNVNDIIGPKLVGMDPAKQEEIDNLMLELDGTKEKKNLGANAILSVSMAASRAGSAEKDMPLYKHIAELSDVSKFVLPVPSMNIINGGEHAGNKLDIQEYMILPTGANNFRKAVRMCAEVYHTLKGIIKEKYGKNAINVGDEGGFAPPLSSVEEPVSLIEDAINKAGYGGKIRIGLDSAASEFFRNGKYHIMGKELSSDELVELYKQLADKFSSIVNFEDPFNQDDFQSYAKLTSLVGSKIQVVGDDLLVTNVERIRKAIDAKACNALLLKVNQIGTITEAIEAAKLAKKNNWGVMVSHRSGETEDPYIADFVVGIMAGQIKSGAPCRSERNAKYNQLMRIEEALEGNCMYAGEKFRDLTD